MIIIFLEMVRYETTLSYGCMYTLGRTKVVMDASDIRMDDFPNRFMKLAVVCIFT